MKYRFLIIGVIISVLAVGVWAAERGWTFDTASDYTYDTSKIEVTGGVARLKALGGDVKDDTIAEYNTAHLVGGTGGYENTAAGPDAALVLTKVTDTTYNSTGTFTSRVLDGGSGNIWQRINSSVTNKSEV